MANQMIALQVRPPQAPNLGAAAAQYSNMMANLANMDKMRRDRAEAEAIRNIMSDPSFNPTDAASLNRLIGIGPVGVDAAQKVMQAQKIGVDLVGTRQQQAEKRVGLVGAGLVGLLRDPSDATLAQTAQTFKAVGMDPAEYEGVLAQISQIPDANQRKIFTLQFINQSEGARNALKFVMPDVKSDKVGDAQVYIDNNAASPTFGQELFRITASPEPVKLNQQVVEGTLYNVNPVTGVAGEATVGDPTASLIPGPRTLTRTDTGIRSPYSVGAAPAAAPAPETTTSFVPPPPVTPIVGAGAPSPVRVGNLTVERLRPVIVAQESRGDYTRVSPKGALGAYQVMPATGRSLANRLGMEWRPELMTANTPEAKQYQDAIGSAAIQEAISAGGGDLVTTAKYYHGGSNRANWGPKTDRYAADIVRRMSGGTPTATAGTPTTTTGAPTTTTPSRTITETQRAKAAKLIMPLIGYNPKTGTNAVSDLISASTSGGLEKIGSDVAGFFGTATSGAKAIGQLGAIKDNMTFEKLRGKLGAQISDADVRLIANTMGDIADASIPAETRLAKWNNVVLPLLLRNAGLPPKEAIDYLRKNPGSRAEFDRKYPGTSAAEILGR